MQKLAFILISVSRTLTQLNYILLFCLSKCIIYSKRSLALEACALGKQGFRSSVWGPSLFRLLERKEEDKHFHLAWRHSRGWQIRKVYM